MAFTPVSQAQPCVKHLSQPGFQTQAQKDCKHSQRVVLRKDKKNYIKLLYLVEKKKQKSKLYSNRWCVGGDGAYLD